MLRRIDNLLERWSPDPDFNDPVTVIEAMGYDPAYELPEDWLAAADIIAFGYDTKDAIFEHPMVVTLDWKMVKHTVEVWASELGIEIPDLKHPRDEAFSEFIWNFPRKPTFDQFIAMMNIAGDDRHALEHALQRSGINVEDDGRFLVARDRRIKIRTRDGYWKVSAEEATSAWHKTVNAYDLAFRSRDSIKDDHRIIYKFLYGREP